MIVRSPEFVAGVRAERKARGEWLARVQTWHEGKSDAWLEGYESAEARIIKLLEDAQVTEAELFDGRTIKVKCESVRADLLIALIKGEK